MTLKTTTEPDIVPGPITADSSKTTTVLGFDPVDTAKDKWFATSKPRSDLFGGCEVIPYIRGSNLFPDIVAAMRTVSSSAHFIYIAAWNLSDSAARGGPGENLQLDPADPKSTVKSILTDADKAGATIRALLFKQDSIVGSRDSSDVVTFINGLAHGLAIHDDHVVDGLAAARSLPGTAALAGHYVGAHHQKIIIVNGSEGLIAFQGGYDLDADRISGFGGGGLHDVHTRIRGTGAKVIADIFLERWNDHPKVSTAQKLPALAFPSPHADNKFVQVTHTYPNVASHPLFGGGTNSFAPSGETTAKKLLLHAIGQATRFIYVEEQYLFDMDVSNALKAALPKLQKLIILIVQSGSIAGETLQPIRRRKEFIDNLPASRTTTPGSPGPPPTPAITTYSGKVCVCQLKTGYVHSKTWIFDDRFAIIGSANVNRRGLTHDSEQTCGIFDTNVKKRWFFAHELRMNLWAKHLGKPPIDFQDPIASSVHWFTPIGGVEAYNPDQGPDADPKGFGRAAAAGFAIPTLAKLVITEDMVWDTLVDPDGS
jgi:hypothetical protein